MRKIEQWMIEAINSQRAMDWGNSEAMVYASNSNTKVTTGKREDGAIVTSVYLHGNLIAQCSGEVWGFKMCGWNTPTTRSRINAIAKAFCQNGVNLRKGKIYSADVEINSYDWF